MAHVALEAKLRASALLQVDAPGPYIGGQGGAIVLQIHGMPVTERLEILRAAAVDPLAVTVCAMTADERVQLFAVAEEALVRAVTSEEGESAPAAPITLPAAQLPMAERLRIVTDAALDPLAILFCLLPVPARRQLWLVAREALDDLTKTFTGRAQRDSHPDISVSRKDE